MTWKELTQYVVEARPRSDAARVTKKPLRLKMKGGSTTPQPKRRRWRYAPYDEVPGEDKRRAEAEERALLLHDAPLTRSQFRAYRTNSG
jgi:hypothetical protein